METTPESIRQLLTATFAELGAADPESISHIFLLRDRNFVGHCFRCGNLQAIWLANRNEIEFHGSDGKLLRTVVCEEQKKAA